MTQPRTDKDLAQIAAGCARLANGDPKQTRALIFDRGLTDDELRRALYYLESNRPLLDRP
ncbi:hypothetical protein [Streptomyces sp. NPDC002122]|uniref:hypothetical protein n=1 Tax=Streptomyces sp. NPDC002122 TaxID=3154407 RepID=UPI00332420C1